MFSQDTGVRETYFSLSYTIVDEEKCDQWIFSVIGVSDSSSL